MESLGPKKEEGDTKKAGKVAIVANIEDVDALIKASKGGKGQVKDLTDVITSAGDGVDASVIEKLHQDENS